MDKSRASPPAPSLYLSLQGEHQLKASNVNRACCSLICQHTVEADLACLPGCNTERRRCWRVHPAARLVSPVLFDCVTAATAAVVSVCTKSLTNLPNLRSICSFPQPAVRLAPISLGGWDEKSQCSPVSTLRFLPPPFSLVRLLICFVVHLRNDANKQNENVVKSQKKKTCLYYT